jgi:hypothetical protein
LYKSIAFITLPFFPIQSALAYTYADKVTVLRSTASEFQCRIHNDADGLDMRLEVDSSVVLYNAVYVGIPYGASVTILSAQGDSLAPLDLDGNLAARLSDKSFPLAVVSKPVTVRGRQFVTVSVFPVVGGSYYRSVTVKLGITGGLRSGGESPDDPRFDRIFKAMLANYEQFQSWPVPAKSYQKAAIVSPSPFRTTATWYKIAVNQTGLYKITGAQLERAGLALDNLESDSIHLFTGGGLPLEVHNSMPRPEFREVAILVNDGGDGVFNSSDYLVFYGEHVDRWLYPAGQTPRFVHNPYTDRNIYWLATSGFPDAGLRMEHIDATPNGPVDTTIETFHRWVHVEENHVLRRRYDGEIFDYYTWYWTDEPELTFFVPTPGIIDGDTAEVRLVGRTNDNNDNSDSLGFMELYVNGRWSPKRACERYFCSYYTTALEDGLNEFRVILWPEVDAPPYFDYLDLVYTSQLIPIDGRLDITLGAFSGTADIVVVDDFTQPVTVLDISEPVHPSVLTGFQRSGGMITFQVNLNGSETNRYFLGMVQQALSPYVIEQVQPVDLRDTSVQVDLFIITSQSLADAVGEYIDYRREDGVSIAVVTVEDIMDNFAYGLYDPTAIRDFLKYAYERYPSPAPSVVLLVGDGTYDFLGHLGTGASNLVPPYIRSDDESASDDNYVYFGVYGVLDSDTSYDTSLVPQDRGYDMLIARWPVRSASEISTIVSKIKRYESPTNFGAWRTNITLVADDEFGSRDDEAYHTTQTEVLEKEHIPPLFHRQKIYLWEYPFVNRRKPAVNDAIVKSLNEGTLLINYVGHGNPDVWAHEYVFTRTSDLPRLNNLDRLPLVFTASCAIGFFDDPKRESMGEDLLALASGGAVGVVSATRLVYSSENAQFNRKVFDVLLYNDSLSICEALYTAKLMRQYGGKTYPTPQENDRAYLFFGDPFLKLGIPKLDIEFTQAPDSLVALGRMRVAGRVVDEQGGIYPYDGRLLITVYDSERQKTYRLKDNNGNVTQKVDYRVTGPSIFRGPATITAGQFDFEFIAPLDIGYGGKGAKIILYAIFDSTDAAGVFDSIVVSDSIAVSVDTVGPVVDYTFPGRSNFISGDPVSRTDVLEITASDPSGINIAGGLGHGITMEIDGQTENTIDLTDLFEYNQDDYTTGKVVYSMEGLSPGKHIFRIKVWDNANNATSIEFAAEILADEKLAIVNLLNYPNPMKDSTRFSLEITQPVRNLTLEIFTLSGRKIKCFTASHPLLPGYYDDIVWRGEDASGDRVATGVYIYKATAVPVNGGEAVQAFGKVVVIN